MVHSTREGDPQITPAAIFHYVAKNACNTSLIFSLTDMNTQNMEHSIAAALSLEAGTNTADLAESLCEDNSDTPTNNEVEAIMDGTTKRENTTNEDENQSESNTIFLERDSGVDISSDLKGQAYIKTDSNEASPLHTSNDQASQDLQAQEDELRELGIDVVDQVSLERRVEAAVSREPLQCPIIILCISKM